MTYQQTILNDKPAGFWMITAPSGTSETDLSGNAKTATITEATNLIDRGYRPLVTGTDTDRAYRFYNTNHKLTYPSLEAWEVNRDHIPFSIELTYQSVDTTTEFILFAPQGASSAYIPDNGLYVKDNVLTFRVSNGSTNAPATYKTQAAAYLNPGQSYHVVAVYDGSKIFLYVDGELADQADVDKRGKFAHTTANFITTSLMVPTDTVKSEAIVDAVSFFRAPLSAGAVKRHYVMSSPNVLDTDVVNSLGGVISKINDEDATKAFDFSARERGWNHPLNKLTDLVVDEDGNLSLKKIAPAKLITGPDYYGNLLSWNQASVEEDTTGFAVFTNSTISRSTAQALNGSASLAVTSTAALDAVATTDTINRIPVTAGKTYTAQGSAKSSVAGRSCRVTIQWHRSNGTVISQSVVAAVAINTSTWTKVSITVTAPAESVSASIQFYTYTPVGAGEITYWDEIGLWEGVGTNWTPPVPSRSVVKTDYSNERVNLLDPLEATAESISYFSNNGNPSCSVAISTAIMASGTASLEVTRIDTTNPAVFVTAPSAQSERAITPGKTYTVIGKARASTGTFSGRSVRIAIGWYTYTGTFISYSYGSSASYSDSSWTSFSSTAVAPAGASRFTVYAEQLVAGSVAGDKIYWDELGFYEGTSPSWTLPAYGPSGINLTDSRTLLLEDIGEHLGQSQGAIGGLVDFTATYNDHVGEQAVAAVSSSDQRYAFEIVKKTDKSLYLRYKYRDSSGAIQTAETSWGAISSLLATQVYFYLEWGGGLATLYINSTSSPAVIAFDAGIPAPEFDKAAYAIIGGGADKKRTWNNFFKWVKLYKSQQPSSEFLFNKGAVNGYTLKLANSLNVSQSGTAKIAVPTGSDGTGTIDQTRIMWEARGSNIAVSTSTDSVENLLTWGQATAETTASAYTVDNSTIAQSFTQYNQGYASAAATATGTTRVGLQQIATIPTAPGRVYTIAISLKSSKNLSGSAKFTCMDALGAYVTDAGITINTTGGGWNTFTGQVTIPANTYQIRFNPYLSSPAVNDIVYFDKMGYWLGADTTWGEPFQAVTHGAEIVPGKFPTTLPPFYYALVTLTTDDSYYNVTRLTDLKMQAEQESTVFAENSWDQIKAMPRERLHTPSLVSVRQPVFGGAYVDSVNNQFYVMPVDDRANTSTPTGGSGASIAGPAEQIRTLEFWLYPETQGYYVLHDGATEYSMRYYDSGGFTTTGFTTLYVDGVSTANAVTSTTWYNRWHHIILTNASAQITINTNSLSPLNLLTPNQASGGDFLGSTSGFTNHTGATVTYDTVQKVSGAGSIKSSSTSPSRHSVSTSAYPVPVIEGKTYTFKYSVRPGASPTGGFTWRADIEWMNAAGTVIGSSLVDTLVTQDVWTTLYVTAQAPAGAASAYGLMYRNAASGGVAEDAWMDDIAFWEGTSTTWVAAESKLWFGRPAIGGTQSTARYQNIAYYPQNFTAGMALANYKAYLGDVTAGSGTDNPGGRTVTEGAGTNPKFFSDNWETQVISVR